MPSILSTCNITTLYPVGIATIVTITIYHYNSDWSFKFVYSHSRERCGIISIREAQKPIYEELATKPVSLDAPSHNIQLMRPLQCLSITINHKDCVLFVGFFFCIEDSKVFPPKLN